MMSKKKTKPKQKTKQAKTTSAPKTPVQRKDPRIEKVYEKEVEFVCPVRGKVKQVVKIKRYKTLGESPIREVARSSDPLMDLDKLDDGLSIYAEDDLAAEKLN